MGVYCISFNCSATTDVGRSPLSVHFYNNAIVNILAYILQYLNQHFCSMDVYRCGIVHTLYILILQA